MEEGWASRPLEVSLGQGAAIALLARAKRLELGRGGRFEVRSERRVYLWSAGRDAEGMRTGPVGCLHLRWEGERVLAEQLSWDPVAGCEADLRRALELLCAGLAQH